LVLGLLGAFLGVTAQEAPPWPPPPVKPPPQTSAGAVPWAPPAAPSGGIVPVQALMPVPADSPNQPPAANIQSATPGIFPANVVPAQALVSEGQPKVPENPPPPMFPEAKTQPVAPPSAAQTEDAGGPMLSPADEIKPPGAPYPARDVNALNPVTVPSNSATPPTIVQEPAPIAFPKTLEQPTQPGIVQPYTAPMPEPRVPAAVPIRRFQGRSPAPAEVVSGKMVVSEASPESALPAALLTLEKRGPAELQLGQPVRFEIVVRNVGSVPATQVRIEDTLPEHVRFLGGNPHPVLEAGRVVWNLPQVLPGQDQRVYVDLQPTAAGDLTTQTILSHTMESRMQVRPAVVGLTVKAPGRAAVGQPVVFEVQLVNTVDQPLSPLILKAQMSEGLMHQDGRSIESDPFDLPAHGEKTLRLTTTARHPGRQSIEVSIIVQGRQEALAHADVFVGEMSLVVHVPATSRIVPGKVSELPIEIGNFDARPARNLVVTSKLPKGLEFEGASDKGRHRGGSVEWVLDYLAPGQARVLYVRVKTRAPAEFVHVVTARAADGIKAQTEGRVVAGGAAQLSLSIAVKDHPLELGKETVFEIRLSNEGSSPDANVQMQALLPEGLAPRSIEGMGSHLKGKLVIFDPIARLDPGKQVVVRIGVLATMPGDRRIRVQAASAQLRTPVTREERTLVYSDR